MERRSPAPAGRTRATLATSQEAQPTAAAPRSTAPMTKRSSPPPRRRPVSCQRCASPRPRRSGAVIRHAGCPPLPRLRESPMWLLAARSAAACMRTRAVARVGGAATGADARRCWMGRERALSARRCSCAERQGRLDGPPVVRWWERIVRSHHCCHSARPALACIICARRAWTVEMISSEEIPCR